MGLLNKRRQKLQQAKKLAVRRRELLNFYTATTDLSYDEISADELEKNRGVFKHTNSGPCWNCKTKTHYIDLCFQSWVCSPKCQDIKDKEYYDHLRKLTKAGKNIYKELK